MAVKSYLLNVAIGKAYIYAFQRGWMNPSQWLQWWEWGGGGFKVHFPVISFNY